VPFAYGHGVAVATDWEVETAVMTVTGPSIPVVGCSTGVGLDLDIESEGELFGCSTPATA